MSLWKEGSEILLDNIVETHHNCFLFLSAVNMNVEVQMEDRDNRRSTSDYS